MALHGLCLGKLFVAVVSGRNLLAYDVTGTSDPYCVLKFGEAEYYTGIVWSTLDPVWSNEHFVFDVPKSYPLELNLWDKDLATKDDAMGYISVSADRYTAFNYRNTAFYQVKKNKKKPTLQKYRGELELHMQYFNYFPFLNLLADKNLEVVKIIHKQNAKEELASALVCIFSDRGQAIFLIEEMIQLEVQATADPNTLFRTNSLATKMMAAITKTSGTAYISKLLRDWMASVMNYPHSVEIDPHKAHGSDVFANRKALIESVERLLTILKTSISIIPQDIRQICVLLRNIVGTKYPERSLLSVGGFFILRFVNPAIANPEHFGFGDIDSLPHKDNVRRHLVLVTKVLQNIANCICSAKEDYMEEVNNFVSKQEDSMMTFFKELSERTALEKVDVSIFTQLTPQELITQLDCVASHFAKHELPAGTSQTAKDMHSTLNQVILPMLEIQQSMSGKRKLKC